MKRQNSAYRGWIKHGSLFVAIAICICLFGVFIYSVLDKENEVIAPSGFSMGDSQDTVKKMMGAPGLINNKESYEKGSP